MQCRCCEHSVIRGWNREYCAKACVFQTFSLLARSVIDLVGSCLSVQPQPTGGPPIVDLNDLRYERILRSNGIEPSWWLEELVLEALAAFRQIIGKEGIVYDPLASE